MILSKQSWEGAQAKCDRAARKKAGSTRMTAMGRIVTDEQRTGGVVVNMSGDKKEHRGFWAHSVAILRLLWWSRLALFILNGCALLLLVIAVLYQEQLSGLWSLSLSILCGTGILQVLLKAAYKSFCTCPNCARRIGYRQLIRNKQGTMLYCPDCNKAFVGKILE